MSNELPNVGDLAEIVHHPCCGKLLGVHMLITAELPIGPTVSVCDFCGQPLKLPRCAISVDGVYSPRFGPMRWWPRAWLRKLPPLAEPQYAIEKIEA